MNSSDRTRKIVVTGVMGAIAALLGWTHWGFIPWVTGTALTIMHVPVIIGAVLEGPWVGLFTGLIFGLFSMLQAAVAPTGPGDAFFLNPLVAVMPRLLIGPVAWLVWRSLKKWQIPALLAAGAAASLTHSVLVLGMIGVVFSVPWPALGTVFVGNSLVEAVISALITLFVVAAWWRIRLGRREGSRI